MKDRPEKTWNKKFYGSKKPPFTGGFLVLGQNRLVISQIPRFSFALMRKEKIPQNDDAQDDPVPAERLEIVLFNIGH